MKTLYSLLGVASDATPAQIEVAYAERLDSLSNTGDEDAKIKLVALKEAYSILSDPIKRQVYNQRLFSVAPPVAAFSSSQSYAVPERTFGLKSILLVGALVLAGIYFYGAQQKEREQLRLQHAAQIQSRAVKLLEEQQKQAQENHEAMLERQAAMDAASKARQEKQEIERTIRDVDARRREDERRREADERRVASEKRDAERRAEDARRRELYEAQVRVQRDKAQLQRYELQHYGKVITR